MNCQDIITTMPPMFHKLWQPHETQLCYQLTSNVQRGPATPFYWSRWPNLEFHYSDVIMDAIASQITSFTIVYSVVCSGADQRKHQSSVSRAFVREIHRSPVTGEFPAQKASNAELGCFLWWRHHDRQRSAQPSDTLLLVEMAKLGFAYSGLFHRRVVMICHIFIKFGKYIRENLLNISYNHQHHTNM